MLKGWRRAPRKSVIGTSLMGYIDVSYRRLVNAFGKPGKGDEYKVDAEWILRTPRGRVATIYNYKDGKSYLGPEGSPVSRIRDWHIGGRTKAVVAEVRKAFGV